MTRPAARVDVSLLSALGGLLPGDGGGRAVGRAGRERAAGGRVSALAASGGGGPAGWWGVRTTGRLDLTMSPHPIFPTQTPFLQFSHTGECGDQIFILRWWP